MGKGLSALVIDGSRKQEESKRQRRMKKEGKTSRRQI